MRSCLPKSSSPGLAAGDLDVTAGLAQLSNSDNLSVSTVQTLTTVSPDNQRSANDGSGSQSLAFALQPLVAVGNRNLGAIPSKAANEVNEDHHACPIQLV